MCVQSQAFRVGECSMKMWIMTVLFIVLTSQFAFAQSQSGGNCSIDACEFSATTGTSTTTHNVQIVCYDASGNIIGFPIVTIKTVVCNVNKNWCPSHTQRCSSIGTPGHPANDICVPASYSVIYGATCHYWTRMNGQGPVVKVCCCT